MAQQIQLRRGTAASATASNPVLAEGETGVETDTGRVKIGDGATAWNSLPYLGAGLTWEGVWDDATVYQAQSAVSHEGASYVANTATTAGDEPGVDPEWDVLAAAGTLGTADLADLSDVDATVPTTGDVLTFDGTWGPAAPTLHGVKAYKSGSAQSVADSTVAAITLDAVVFDTGGLFNAGVVTLDRDGYWGVAASNYFSANGTGIRETAVRLDSVQQGSFVGAGISTNAHTTLLPTIIIAATVGDVLDMTGYQNSGGALDVNPGASFTYLSAYFIGV